MAFIIDGTTGIATVDGSVSAPSQRGQDSNSGISYAADTIKFSTGGVERMSITNSGISGISAGITEYDAWYLTANKTSTGVLDANLIRNNRTANAAPLGTGMSESSGVFTFPSTGKYLVIVQATYELAGGDNVSVHTEVTTDNSNYVDIAHAFDGNGGSNNRLGGNASFSFIDVTDTSNVKVRFYADSINSGSAVRGIDSSSTFVQTAFHFIRIGDT